MTLRILAGILIGAGIGSVTGYYGKCSSGTCPLTATPLRGAVYGGVVGLFLALTLAAPGRRDVPSDKVSASAGSGVAKSGPVVAPDAEKAVTENEEALVHIMNTKQFEQRILQATVPCLVDLYSDNCPPCRMLAPTIEKLAERYRGRALVCKVSLDGGMNVELARRYGIRGIPTVLFFHGGKEVDRYVGLREEEDYASVLDRLLPNEAPSGEAAGLARDTPTPETGQ